ncbi:DNA primase [Levilactobacillus bambusae]|uniref:DNA primase n=1 Tax=Levilactobacillus bambusae TaxID=2024736 RepID=A0A2V1N425_9LACO|nr:DNA primase [Levilactobacillus bambusae]PWG00775.1 DNA primase [Levilactobacillus bambusae]
MARLPETVIEDVRQATNIADYIGQYVQLRKQGQNLFGLCPFHEERTPSFSVSEDKQIFHCFSCGRGGNVFKFVMELDHLSFPEAVLKVADFSHVTLDESYRPKETGPSASSETGQLMALHEDATKLYHHVLMNTEAGQSALDYLHGRGLTDETIETYQLGFAPAERLLKPFVDQRQLDYQLLRKSGLFIESQTGDLRDRFADRLMFPIRNSSGRVIAFSGRLLELMDGQPKYLNSPETELFSKRKTVFNFDLARPEIRKMGAVILFEGFMDVISAHQAGVLNGIASMGTSLTKEQIYTLERVTDQLLICYDGDMPGQKATSRALQLIGQQSQLKLGVIQMPDGLDPDEYRQKYGADKFQAVMTSAKETPVAFQMRYMRHEHALNTEADKLAYLNEMTDVLTTVKSPVELDLYLNQLATEFHVSPSDLRTQVEQSRRKKSAAGERQRPNQPVSPVPPEPPADPAPVTVHQQNRPLNALERAEKSLLYWMLHENRVWLKVTTVNGFCFVHEDYQLIFTLAEGYFQTHGHDAYQPSQFTDYLHDDSLSRLVIGLELMDMPTAVTDEEVDDYVAELMNRAPLSQRLKQKKAELAEANRVGDTERQTGLVMDIIKLEQQRQQRQQA